MSLTSYRAAPPRANCPDFVLIWALSVIVFIEIWVCLLGLAVTYSPTS